MSMREAPPETVCSSICSRRSSCRTRLSLLVLLSPIVPLLLTEGTAPAAGCAGAPKSAKSPSSASASVTAAPRVTGAPADGEGGGCIAGISSNEAKAPPSFILVCFGGAFASNGSPKSASKSSSSKAPQLLSACSGLSSALKAPQPPPSPESMAMASSTFPAAPCDSPPPACTSFCASMSLRLAISCSAGSSEHSVSTYRYMAAAVLGCESLSRMFAALTSKPARNERA
mmetsp:Transcript_4022/g.9099  ORF Transcript_4022/g.9099 Transcript_4022/m.9099 type:complete len:229 (-) Transcript_4022:533-1219(-)